MCPASAIRRIRSSEYQPSALRDGDEVLVHVGHEDAGLVPHEGHREERLDPRAAPGDDGDRAGGGDGGDVAVAEPAHRADPLAAGTAGAGLVGPPDAPLPLRKDAALGRQSLRFDLGFFIHELLNPAAERDALIRVVRDAELDEEIGQPHDAEADSADALSQVGDLGQRILVGVDHVLEEMGSEVDHRAERVPVDRPIAHEDAEIDRAEVADVVRAEGAAHRRGWWPRTRRGAAPDCSSSPCR